MTLKNQEQKLQEKYEECMQRLADKEYQVSAKQQADFIEEIRALKKWGYFCFSVDLEKYAEHATPRIISDVCGLTEHLGYFAQDFSMEKYHRALYPEFSYTHYRYAIALVTLLTEIDHGIKLYHGQGDSFSFKPLFTFIQSIRHQDDENRIFLVRRQLYPFQWNSKNQMTKYLNVFHIICEGSKDYSFHFLNAGQGKEENTLREILIEKVKKEFIKEPFFDHHEIFLIQKYIHSGFKASNQVLLNHFNDKFPGHFKSLNDIKNIISKRILPKANAAFPKEEFTRMRQVAGYLNKHNLL